VKLNDSYFNTASYNTPAWRLMVMCQEVGHTFGLAHQDEVFANPNLGSCMDYTNDPDGGRTFTPGALDPSNEHLNAHDPQQLNSIYTHTDSPTTTTSPTLNRGGQALPDEAGDTPAEWGTPVRHRADGRPILYRRDVSGGRAVFTWVRWADQPGAAGGR